LFFWLTKLKKVIGRESIKEILGWVSDIEEVLSVKHVWDSLKVELLAYLLEMLAAKYWFVSVHKNPAIFFKQ